VDQIVRQEKMSRRTKIIIGASLVVLGLLFASPELLSQYWVMVLISCLIFTCLGYGFRFLFLAGRLTIGAIAFAGIGAYTAALLTTKVDIPVLTNPWTGLFFGAIMAALIAIPIGIICLKVPGLMFAILTMAFVELFRYVLIMWSSLTNGIGGVLDIPAFSFPGYGSFGIDRTPYLYLIIIIAAVTMFVMYRIERTRVGLSMLSMAQNNELARHLGMDTFKYRLVIFAIVGLFAGLVGGFQAHYWHYVSPMEYQLLSSLLIMICPVVGGLMSPVGPIVGAFTLIGLTEGLRVFQEWAGLFFGGILLFVVFVLPGGLVTLPRAIYNTPQAIMNSPQWARMQWGRIRDKFAPIS
jgi:branched-chain amino acid transport system permease protein